MLVNMQKWKHPLYVEARTTTVLMYSNFLDVIMGKDLVKLWYGFEKAPLFS